MGGTCTSKDHDKLSTAVVLKYGKFTEEYGEILVYLVRFLAGSLNSFCSRASLKKMLK
jgi:hypothetical protein